jgi:dTDP-4-amino-4,6-dideoxygalactose transaminase
MRHSSAQPAQKVPSSTCGLRTPPRHYPDPVHRTPAYRGLGYANGAFPVAERLARTVLSLPLYPGVSDQQLDVVVEATRDYFDRV